MMVLNIWKVQLVKMKHKGIIIVGCICLLLIMGGVFAMNHIIDQADRLSMKTPDLEKIDDGIYEGKYGIVPVSVVVQVSVQNHKMVDIAIVKHENGLGGKAEKVVKDIIKTQSLDEDPISGATVSSKCIMKAIEQALVKGE